MGLDLLDNPIRVTWDLQGDQFRMPASVSTTVLQRVIDARLFFVTLEQRPFDHPQCEEIIHHLNGAGIQPLLFCDGTDAELSRLASANNTNITVLLNLQPFLTPSGPDSGRLHQVVQAMRQQGLEPGFSLVPLRSNIEHLQPLIESAKDLKIQHFKLPNVRIDDNFQQSVRGEVLRPDDLVKLRSQLGDTADLTTGIELEIHDLFLWELLAPDNSESRSEYGGCQAGNSLAHITRDGIVWPCVTWPISLGSLLDQPFSEIWSSEKRLALRHRVASQPAGCADCSDYHICFGGCRGLSDVLDIDGGLDPMCSGPRVL